MDFTRAVEEIKKARKILIVSHYDCDGLCSAEILSTALKREGKVIKIKIVKELSEEIIKELETLEKDLIIFSDLGSGCLSLLPREEKIIVLDHHTPEDITPPNNIIHINPTIDGKELCGSGICYLLASKLGNNRDLIDYAIIGAIGDNQLDVGENLKIREEARKLGRLKIEKGLKIFGHVNRPLHESLRTSQIFPLNDHSQIVQFLSELEIDLIGDGKIKSYYDLTEEEKEKLILGIIKERIRNDFGEHSDIISNIYLLVYQPRKLIDALEYSTILNAFGRLEKYEEALELMNGKLDILEEVLQEYRKKLANYLEWVTKNMENFYKTSDIIFINAGDNIDANLIGTITSIFINTFADKKIVVGLAYDNGTIKISARAKKEVDLDKILNEICEKLGGRGGGHKQAAGGRIDKEREEEFIKYFVEYIEKRR
jgi:RecJ-like exonuclease